MRAVIQRVEQAAVTVDGQTIAEIGTGLLILLGVENEDNQEDIEWLGNKISQMRIFSDAEGKMNLNVDQAKGNILVVSQFTLHASIRKGNRPSFVKAAAPEDARKMYKSFIENLDELIQGNVNSGEFGSMMKISLVNDGPVTIIADTKNRE